MLVTKSTPVALLLASTGATASISKPQPPPFPESLHLPQCICLPAMVKNTPDIERVELLLPDWLLVTQVFLYDSGKRRARLYFTSHPSTNRCFRKNRPTSFNCGRTGHGVSPMVEVACVSTIS